MKKFETVTFDGVSIPLEDYRLIKFSGTDVKTFLQGQTTHDVSTLKSGHGQINTVLNIQGKIDGQFYLGLIEDNYYLLIEKSREKKIIERLEKYIIMEDISFSTVESKCYLLTGVKGLVWALEHQPAQSFLMPYCNDMVALSFSEQIEDYFTPISSELHDDWLFYSQWPVDGETEGLLINDTRLNEWAISYDKGCFLGQEVVAKINNNRGAAYYPAFLVSDHELKEDIHLSGRKIAEIKEAKTEDDKVYHWISLFRDYRIDGKQIEQGELKLIPFVPAYKSLKEKVYGIYEYALSLSNNYSRNEEALDLLECCIKFDPDLLDAYEVAGVIYGHQGEFKKAISYMDRLLEREPKSVMAHTNKSLYFMKLGDLEKAEEEKAKATLLSFEKNASSSEEIEKQKKQQEEMILRKEKMFKDVLNLDDKDETAHYGLGEIALGRGQFLKAIDHFKIALDQNKKLSNAYLKLGKAYLEINKHDEAKNIFTTGIEIAAAQGDMMPANEMQRLLVSNEEMR